MTQGGTIVGTINWLETKALDGLDMGAVGVGIDEGEICNNTEFETFEHSVDATSSMI